MQVCTHAHIHTHDTHIYTYVQHSHTNTQRYTNLWNAGQLLAEGTQCSVLLRLDEVMELSLHCTSSNAEQHSRKFNWRARARGGAATTMWAAKRYSCLCCCNSTSLISCVRCTFFSLQQVASKSITQMWEKGWPMCITCRFVKLLHTPHT